MGRFRIRLGGALLAVAMMTATAGGAQAVPRQYEGPATAGAVAARPPLRVLVLGDSYSAGNGAGSYYGAPGCYRSHQDYAEVFAATVRKAPYNQPATVINAACSGAVTADFTHSKSGRPPELDAVNTHQDVVFLTIGGNDVDFADIVTQCLVELTRQGAKCDADLARAEHLLGDGTVSKRITTVLRGIRARTNTSARIVLLGYPFLEGDQHYTVPVGPGKNARQVQVGKRLHALGVAGDAMDKAIVKSLDTPTSGSPFVFVSTQALFNGPPYHGLYAAKTNPKRWMVQPVADKTVSRMTYYHPNPTGWAQEGRLLARSAGVPVARTYPRITTTALPDATAGLPYSAPLTTADHRQGTWEITAGTLPAGLKLVGATITGTPQAVGASSATVQFTDVSGLTATAQVTLRTGVRPPVILNWTAPLSVDPQAGPGRAIACADADRCVVTDRMGYATALRDGAWPRPAPVDPSHADSLKSVSCVPARPADPPFCAAAGSGSISTWNGSRWTRSEAVPGAAGGVLVSCATSTFCGYVDAFNDVYLWDGTAFGAPTELGPGTDDITALACPATTLCVAGTREGATWSYSDDSWTGPVSLSPDGLSQLACPTVTFCLALDNAHHAYTFDGTSWRAAPAPPADSAPEPAAMSCASATYCLAFDNMADFSVYDGARWSDWQGAGFWYAPAAVSCTAVSACHAVDLVGNAYALTGDGWSGRTAADPYRGGWPSVSCVGTSCTASDRNGNTWTTEGDRQTSLPELTDTYAQGSIWGMTSVSCAGTFCALTDMIGGATTRSGGAWSGVYLADPQNARLDAVALSCASASFCAAVDDSGWAITWNGSHWAAPVQLETYRGEYGLSAVSCATAAFCVAVSGHGTAYRWTGTAWTATATAPTGTLNSLSCPTTTWCAAVMYGGGVETFDGHEWSAIALVDPGHDLFSVSCPVASFCAATDNAGQALTWNGVAWSQPIQISDTPNLTRISCGSSSFCAAVTSDGTELFGTGSPAL